MRQAMRLPCKQLAVTIEPDAQSQNKSCDGKYLRGRRLG